MKESTSVGATGAPPRILIWISGLVTVAGLVMMFVGAWNVGATWDERTHVIMLQTFLEQGWNVTPDALLPDGTIDPNFIWGVYVYGPVGELVAHASSALLGLESWGEPIYTAASTSGRHVGIALMGLLGVVATALIVQLILNSWKYALLGAALLASIPLWIGHSMFNIKDLPVATGYTIGTLGLVALVHPRSRVRRRIRWGGASALALGAVLASGTREAMGAPLAAAAVGVPLALFILRIRSTEGDAATNARDALSRSLWSVGALVVGYLGLVAIYPKAFADPINLAWQALVVSARFPFDEPVLTAGMWLDQPPPWSYLPLWFGAQLPLLISAFALVAVIGWVMLVVRSFRPTQTWLAAGETAMIFAVLLQAFMMPVLGVLLRSNMYDAQRQFLFSVPALAVLAALGIRQAVAWIRSKDASEWGTRMLWLIVGVGLVVPTIGQAFLMPYNYTYFNPVAAMGGINDRWATDYWRASSNELMRRTPSEGPEYCAFESGRKGELSPCSVEQMFEPYVAQRGRDARDGTLDEGGYWLIRENKSGTQEPADCELFDSVTRPLWGEEMVIGQIFRCSP